METNESPWRPFVLQHHQGWEQDHFDLMLEWDGKLLTWQIERDPADGGEQPARKLPDHRLAYLTYEGPISNGRGRCTIARRGQWRPLAQQPDLLRFELQADGLSARFDLVHRPGDAEPWTLKKLSRI